MVGAAAPPRTVVRVLFGYALSPTVPCTLRSLVTDEEWKAFATEYDAIVVSEWNRRVRFPRCCLSVLPLIGFALTLVGGFKTSHKQQHSSRSRRWDSGDDSLDHRRLHPGIVLGPILLVASFVTGACLMGHTAQYVEKACRTLCERQTEKHAAVSFVWRQDQVVTRDREGDALTTTLYFVDIFSKNAHPGGGDVERPHSPLLQELAPAMVLPAAPAMVTAVTLLPATTTTQSTSTADSQEIVQATEVVVLDPGADNRNATSGGDARTIRQRLEELERLRDVLTGEEYQAKRNDILNRL